MVAAHLTDEQKKKIIADYTENGSYRATAKMNNVSAPTVKKVVVSDVESLQKFAQKREKNTLDMLAYMDSRKEQAQGVIDDYLKALADPSKIEMAKLSEVATAMGIVMDKFINNPVKNKLEREKLELEKRKVESQLADDSTDKFAERLKDMETLADILRKPVPNQDIEDFE